VGLLVNQEEIVVQRGSYTDSKYQGKNKGRKEMWVRHSEEPVKIIKK
jgi:hypothetical protein